MLQCAAQRASEQFIMFQIARCFRAENFFLHQENNCSNNVSNQVRTNNSINESTSSEKSIISSFISNSEIGKIYEEIPVELLAENISKPNFGATKTSLIKAGLRVSLRSRIKSNEHVEPAVADNYLQPNDAQLFDDVEATEPLTVEDREKRRERREKNKVAARKCRQRRKASWDELMNQEKLEEQLHSQLKSEIQQLRKELDKLEMMLRYHNCHFMRS